jgi:phage/plasmid-associated DNA primase
VLAGMSEFIYGFCEEKLMVLATSTALDLKFQINDYLERLTPSKKGRYHCPICNSPKFSIKKGGAGYQCWEGGCDNKEIQLAIRPAAEVKQLLEADRDRKRKAPIPYRLSAAHLKEMSLSGIPEGLGRLNIRSVEDAHQIASFLDWKGYMGVIGWLYTGVDPETGFDTGVGQFKPDEKFSFPNGNLAKYLSQKHAYDAACFRVPYWVMQKVSTRYGVPMPEGMAVVSDSSEVTTVFWRWVIDNPQLPISPAEGGKKALLLLAEGRIGISISGVDMATIGRGVDLVPTLKKLAVKGRPVEPFYDADIIEKPDVENALMAFGTALTRAGCVVTVPTWALELGKGVDDLAVNEGEGWESCLAVLSYKDWLKKLEQQRQTLKKRSPVKKAQSQKVSNVSIPVNLKVLQIAPSEYLAGQHFEAIQRILSETPVNEPVAPLIFGTEEDAEFARQYSIGSIATADDEAIQRTIGQLQGAGCRAVAYFANSNKDVEQLLMATCDQVGIACAVIDSEVFYPDIQKGDIRRIVTTMNADDFIQRIEDELHSRAQEDKEHQENLAIGDDEGISKKSEKPPLPQLIGGWFAEDLRERLIYSEQHQSWMAYELNLKGVWTAVGDAYVLNAIESMCRNRDIYPNNNYVANVLGTLKRILFCLEWTERPSCEMLPFEDGVLQIGTTVFREHAPGDRLTWSLERPYRGSAVRSEGWGAIAQWLSEATEGNARKQEILLAFAAAALRGMSSVQKFLMLTGPGGTGKGVFSHLLTLVLGERNTWIGNLEDLNKPDRIAELQTKRLALFDDQERYMGNLSNFRSLTGGGKISGRQLYKSAINFKFNGLALVTANQPCFPATGISWLKRRIIQQEFRHQPAKRNIHLQSQLAPELSAFTRHLLSIPVAEIERLLGEEMTGLNHTFWEDRIQADPLASWINDNLIHDATAEVAIGSDKDEWKDGNYDAARSTAFGSYNYICRSGNSIPLSKNKFSANLIELCQSVLGWRDVAKTRKGDARYIVGVRLRTSADTTILPLDQTLNDDDRQHDDDLSVNLNPIYSKGCADVDNLLQTFSEKNTTNLELVQNMEIQSNPLTDSLLTEKLGDDTANVSTTYTQQETGSSKQPTSMSSLGSSQAKLLLLQDYARRMGEALVYKSPAVATAIFGDIQSSIVSQEITKIEITGFDTWQAFNELRALTTEEGNLVEIIQSTIAGNDRETAKTVLAVIKQVCNSGAADRDKVWFAGLTESERVAFSALAK